MKYLTHPVTLFAVGLIVGAAFGASIPVVSTIAAKIKGATA